MRTLNKKGVLDNLGNLITALGTLAILAAIIFVIIAETADQVVSQDPCSNATQFYNSTSDLCQDSAGSQSAGGESYSYTYNATRTTRSAASDIPGWFPIVVITMIGGILLTLVRLFRSR